MKLTSMMQGLLLLAAVAAVVVVPVKCNYTIASAAVDEMMDDPEEAAESWIRVGKEATEWGKDKVKEGLGLKQPHDYEDNIDNGDHTSNVSKETKSKTCQTVNDNSGDTKEKCKHLKENTYKTTTIKETTPDREVHESSDKGHPIAYEVEDRVSSTKDATSEKVEQVWDKTREYIHKATDKASKATRQSFIAVEEKVEENAKEAAMKAKESLHKAKEKVLGKSSTLENSNDEL